MDHVRAPKRSRSIESESISSRPKRRTVEMPATPLDRHNDTNRVSAAETVLKGETGALSQPAIQRVVPSPFRLNLVEELPHLCNVNTVSLGSILGDPLIRECWLFNYLFDMDFVMSHFDPTIRRLKVKVVHGVWKEFPQDLKTVSERYHNVEVITAPMRDLLGCHHARMIVLFRQDDLAQVIILTANFTELDWQMSQAIWQSPLLPKQNSAVQPSTVPPMGSGRRFKRDILAYLRSYDVSLFQQLFHLTWQLEQHDFSQVKGALIASTPGMHDLDLDPDRETIWGLPSLGRILEGITISQPFDQSQIAVQTSSVASLDEKWLTDVFIPTLSATKRPSNPIPLEPPPSQFHVIFPTASAIRNSVSGYSAGTSIHMSAKTQANPEQNDFLRPMLRHWAVPLPILQRLPNDSRSMAYRSQAAPHTKTYIRFSDKEMTKIDWAMITSANLSMQAWGSRANLPGQFEICNYELGVVVWPGLWDGDGDATGPGVKGGQVEMVPVFAKDTPDLPETKKEQDTPHKADVKGKEDREWEGNTTIGEGRGGGGGGGGKVTVGIRMPYDLPLVAYKPGEEPWSQMQPCMEPDRLGKTWPGWEYIPLFP